MAGKIIFGVVISMVGALFLGAGWNIKDSSDSRLRKAKLCSVTVGTLLIMLAVLAVMYF